MSLINFMFLGKKTDNFNKNIPYSIESTYNPDGRYRFGFTMTKNPTNNVILDLYRLGDDHFQTDDGVMVFRESTDFGQTWGAETILLDDLPTKAVSNFAAGYSSNGRLHILMEYTNSNDFDYYYSDDDGGTLSAAATIAQPDVNLALYVSTLCEMIQVENTLYFPVYGFTDHLDTTESANYVLKSVNGGTDWTWTVVRARDSININESSMAHLGGVNFLYVSRVSTTTDFKMYFSTDGAATFTDKSNTNFGGVLDATHPPLLVSFEIKRQQIIALYFFARVADKFYVIYAKASDLISLQDWTAFNTNTLLELENYPAPWNNDRTGYPTVQHPYNDLRGVFMYSGEVSISEAAKRIGILPTNHYDSLVTELGI